MTAQEIVQEIDCRYYHKLSQRTTVIMEAMVQTLINYGEEPEGIIDDFDSLINSLNTQFFTIIDKCLNHLSP